MKNFILKIVVAITLIFGGFFASSALISPDYNPLTKIAYADEDEDSPEENNDEEETPETEEGNQENNAEKPKEDTESICSKESGAVAWILCSVMQTAGRLTDRFYSLIEDFLIVEPISTDHESATYQVWAIVRDITNIIFIIFALLVIYSQLTGLGLNNYGIKRTLPRLIIAAILVNLSYFIASVAVDISNIVGASISGFLGGIQDNILTNTNIAESLDVSWSSFTNYFTVGIGTAAIAFVAYGGIESVLWAVGLALIGAVISLVIGLATIALRQGVIILLVMISPLAFVAYLLPNTEKWFEKWKGFFFQMLVFYPMFSLLFGATKLAGWAVIAAADKDPIKVLIGLAVQVMPLFLSFTLFKMSGNALGAINAGLHKLSNPMRDGIEGWGRSHQELARQKYLGNQYTPGAKLRGYLDYRKALREADTEKAAELRKNRAIERASHKSASYRGLDEEGQARVGNQFLWKGRPNSHTRLQKKASLYATRAATAQQLLDNNLSEYGDIFKGRSAAQLGNAHAKAFESTMAGQFRAENIAQGDQSYLLNRYLDAAKNRERSPYEFNRLIGGATGTNGHFGEASIIGQVIDRSVQIETRRRREALVVANKFGYSKAEFRGMVFDKNHINDDGFEEDEYGQVIEDQDYRLLPGKKHRGWQKYIGVHKKTRKEITKEEYDALSSGERANYDKIRYMEIRDDSGDVVQRVYNDDAGYMKELLAQDITIGDPINMRYLMEIGLARPTSQLSDVAKPFASHEKTGILRRYHSTIANAMLSSKYAEHNAAVTAMLTAQANNGFITSVGQYRLAELDSLWKAAKSGKILQNDAIVIRNWTRIIKSLTSDEPGERFEDIITDADIALNRNVNGLELHGLRKRYNDDGSISWDKIDRHDPSITVKEMRNWVERQVMPKVETKVMGSIDRKPSPEILNSQKPEATEAFFDLIDAVADHNIATYNNLPEEERAKAKSLFDTKDPYEIRQYVSEARQQYNEMRNSHKTKDGVPLGNHQKTYFNNDDNSEEDESVLAAARSLVKALERRKQQEERQSQANNPLEASKVIFDMFDEVRMGSDISFAALSNEILEYASEHLHSHYKNISDIIHEVEDSNRIDSIENGIRQTTDHSYDAEAINELIQELESYLNSHIN